MIATRILLALALTTAFVALAPPASAKLPCVEGAPDCAVYLETRQCVTSPCDWLTVCVAWGLYCKDFTS